MIAYAESSAVLAWVLGEPAGEDVRAAFGAADRVVSSTLTVVECGRALSRAAAMGRLRRTEELAALRLLDGAAASWVTHELTGRVLSIARSVFPVEPVRTLDALHIATAAVFREAVAGIAVVSLDERVRANAEALGMAVRPIRL